MQRYFLVLIFLCLFAATSTAQSKWYGVKGGLNISTLGNKSSGYTSKLGYHFGMYGSRRFFQELGVDMELMVSYQGARNSDINDLRLNYTYLTLPVMANIYFREDFAVELGMQFGYLLRAVQSESGDKQEISENVNSFDFSGIIGIGYKNHKFGSGLRYVLGITNTNSSIILSDVYFGNKVFQIYFAKSIWSN